MLELAGCMSFIAPIGASYLVARIAGTTRVLKIGWVLKKNPQFEN